MKLVLLQMLDQRAAGAMHDALGHAGRAGRIEDVKRVIERQLLEGEVLRLIELQKFFQRDRARYCGGDFVRLAEIRNDDDRFRRRQLPGDGHASRGAKSIRLTVLPITVDGDEKLGLDLAEAVEACRARRNRASRTTRWRRPRPRPASARWSPADSDHRRDAVAPCRCRRLLAPAAAGTRVLSAPRSSGGRAPCPRRERRARHCRRRAPAILGEIEARIRKEPRAGHLVAVDEAALALLANHIAEIPDQVPKTTRARRPTRREARDNSKAVRPCRLLASCAKALIWLARRAAGSGLHSGSRPSLSSAPLRARPTPKAKALIKQRRRARPRKGHEGRPELRRQTRPV